jgi:hypothetical protein
MSQRGARRSALDAQAVLRKQRADRERRLEGLAVAVLTALGERDALIRDVVHNPHLLRSGSAPEDDPSAYWPAARTWLHAALHNVCAIFEHFPLGNLNRFSARLGRLLAGVTRLRCGLRVLD